MGNGRYGNLPYILPIRLLVAFVMGRQVGQSRGRDLTTSLTVSLMSMGITT